MPDNDWALRFLANVGEDFYGTLALEFRAGQVEDHPQRNVSST